MMFALCSYCVVVVVISCVDARKTNNQTKQADDLVFKGYDNRMGYV